MGGMESSDDSRASSIAEVPFSASAAKEFMAELERIHAEGWSSSESEVEVEELESSDTLSEVDEELEMKIVEENIPSSPVVSQHQVRKAISSFDFETSPVVERTKGGSVMTARIKAAFSENKLNQEKEKPI